MSILDFHGKLNSVDLFSKSPHSFPSKENRVEEECDRISSITKKKNLYYHCQPHGVEKKKKKSLFQRSTNNQKLLRKI